APATKETKKTITTLLGSALFRTRMLITEYRLPLTGHGRRKIHGKYAISHLDPVHHIQTLFHCCKNCIPPVEVRRWRMCDEPLRAFSVFSCRGHAHTSGGVS